MSELGLFVNKRKKFADPRLSLEDGIVQMMDEIDTPILLEAYSFGIFPWPHEDLPLLWFSPDPRGILYFEDFHISKSLKKTINKNSYTFTINKAFEQVIKECSSVPRPGQFGTWITSPVLKAYNQFHRDGYAHSIECWEGAMLVGGIYGVYVGGVFSAESMFYKKSNCSKLCLIKLVQLLMAQGHKWMDVQMVTHNLEAFGAKYVARNSYLEMLEQQKKSAKNLILNLY